MSYRSFSFPSDSILGEGLIKKRELLVSAEIMALELSRTSFLARAT